MLFKFKSLATADLIMLEPNGRRVLQIIGKSPDDSHGIVTVAQIPAAIAALETAVLADDAVRAAATDDDEGAPDDGRELPRDSVSLRQRAAPFIDMLRRSAAEDHDVVW
ncbi:DUF1840 domain-containing protein [Alicycliphilus denitrificans]|uniref:DUF1840 domain-containing protein n=1 Tax=Alicycliphilus denitrificans TaxID=179636 RepID=UPI003850ABC8